MKKALQALVLVSAICFQLLTPMIAGVGSFVMEYVEKDSVVASVAAHAPVAYAQEVNESNQKLPGCGVGIFSSSSVIGCIAQVFYFLFVYVLGAIASIAGDLFDYFLWFTIDSETYSAKNDIIQKGWDVVRDITNIFFVVGLLIAAISLLFNLSEGGGPRILFGIIVVALVINFSLFFVRIIIDAGNITGLIFYNKITANKVDSIKSEGEGLKSISSVLMSKFNPQLLFNTDLYNNGGLTESAKAGRFLLMTVFAGILHVMLIIVFLSVCMFFVSRVIALWFSMIFAPFALITKAIPFLNTEKLKFLNFNQWISNLLSNAFLVGVFMFLIYVVALMSSDLTSSIQQANGSDSFVFTALKVAMPFILVASFLWTAKKAAQALAGEFGEMVTAGVSMLAVGTVGAVALGAAGVSGLAGMGLRGVGAGLNATGAKGAGKAFTRAGKAVPQVFNPFKWKKSEYAPLRAVGKTLSSPFVGGAAGFIGKQAGLNTGLMAKAAGLGTGMGIGKWYQGVQRAAWQDRAAHAREDMQQRRAELDNKRLDEIIATERAQLEMQELEYKLSKKQGKDQFLLGADEAKQNEKAEAWKAQFINDLDNGVKSGKIKDIVQYTNDYKAGKAKIYDEKGQEIGTSPAEEKSAQAWNMRVVNNEADDLVYGEGFAEARDKAKDNNWDNLGSYKNWLDDQKAKGTFTETTDPSKLRLAQELRKRIKPEKPPLSAEDLNAITNQYRTATEAQEKNKDTLEKIKNELARKGITVEIADITPDQIKEYIKDLKDNENVLTIKDVSAGYTGTMTYSEFQKRLKELQVKSKLRGKDANGLDRGLTEAEAEELVRMQDDKKIIDARYDKMKDVMDDYRKRKDAIDAAKKTIARG